MLRTMPVQDVGVGRVVVDLQRDVCLEPVDGFQRSSSTAYRAENTVAPNAVGPSVS